MVTYTYTSPTSHTEPSGDWKNPTRVYDGNWNNNANVNISYLGPLGYRTNFLVLNFTSPIIIDRVRFKWSNTPNYEITIDAFNTQTSAWETVWNDFITTFCPANASPGVVGTTEISFANKTIDKVRIAAHLSGVEFDLYELDVRRVVPDSPAEPIPPTPSNQVAYDQEKKEETSTAATGAGHTRVRTLHRRTILTPLIIGS